jgi:hypothetical protein
MRKAADPPSRPGHWQSYYRRADPATNQPVHKGWIHHHLIVTSLNHTQAIPEAQTPVHRLPPADQGPPKETLSGLMFLQDRAVNDPDSFVPHVAKRAVRALTTVRRVLASGLFSYAPIRPSRKPHRPRGLVPA